MEKYILIIIQVKILPLSLSDETLLLYMMAFNLSMDEEIFSIEPIKEKSLLRF